MKKLVCPDCGREFMFPEHSTPTQTGLDALPPTVKIICGSCGFPLDFYQAWTFQEKIRKRKIRDMLGVKNAKN